MIKKLAIACLAMALSAPLFAQGGQEASASSAAGYPVKKVTFICPSAAGGAMDSNIRLLAPYLEKYLGMKVDVVNMGGSACWVGWKYLYEQKKDGSYISFANFPNMITGYLDPQANLGMDRTSFEFLAMLTSDDNVVMAKPGETRFTNGKEFLDYARNNVVTLGDAGARTDDAVAVALLEKELGFTFQHVHFQNSAEGFAALLGGHVDALVGNVSEAVSKGGDVLSLLTLAKERSSYLPDVQCTYELGVKVDNSSSRGVVAAKGLDATAKRYLLDALKKAMEDPELLENAQKQGVAITPVYGDDFSKWAETQETNIKGIYNMLDN